MFNVVNLHVYHYAGNNPVKYVDPDGKKSGIALDHDGVFGFGHAGMFVELDNGRFAFFEVTDLPDWASVGSWISVGGTKKFGSVLSNTALKLPTPGSAGSLGKYANGGVLRRDFENYETMETYMKEAGYDVLILRDTTKEQENTILATAMKLGSEFEGYNLLGNQCGTYVEDTLKLSNSGWNFDPNFSSIVPNNIGSIFYKSNEDAYLKFLNPKLQNSFLLDIGKLNILE